MKHILAFSTLLLTSLLTSASQPVTLDSIRKSDAYKKATLSELELIPQKKVNPDNVQPAPAVRKLTLQENEAITKRISSILEKLTGHSDTKIDIAPYPHTAGVTYVSGKHDNFMFYAYLDTHLQITHFSIDSEEALLAGDKKTNKDSFGPHASNIYELIFGSEPAGELSFLHEGKGLTHRTHREIAYWRHKVEGLSNYQTATISLQKKNTKDTPPWHLTADRGITTQDAKSISAQLAKIPSNLSDEEACAIALKALEKLKCLQESTPYILPIIERGKHSMHINVPVISHGNEENRAQWKAKGAKPLNLKVPRYCIRIKFMQGQHQNEIFIDWTTKKIIHINSYMRICW